MNTTIVAMKNVDNSEHARRSEGIEHELKLASARDAREALPSTKNTAYANNFRRIISERKEEVDRLFDQQAVALAGIDDAMGEKIKAESEILSALTKQVEESRARLERLEAEKVREKTETRQYFDKEIEETRKTIRAFEAASAELAKEID